MSSLERDLSRQLAELRALLSRLEQRPGREQEREIADRIWTAIDEVRSAQAALTAQRQRHPN